jgi:hypothetical protein
METTKMPTQNRERGQTIILVALALIALIAFVGLATDVALVYVAKGHLQRAIDAAALAAANKLPDQAEARAAAYEFTRLHGYSFAPGSDPLDIAFPISDPPRKIAAVTGTVEVDLAFLKVIGWQTAEVTASGVGESAPLDVYLVLDMSASMGQDTPQPWWWSYSTYRNSICPLTGCPSCSSWFFSCQEFYCSYEGALPYPANYKERNCVPLDTGIKPAANFFVDQLNPLYDRIGVVTYDQEAELDSALTDNFGDVRNAIDSAELWHVAEMSTNIGDGIFFANHYMSLPSPPDDVGGRTDSVWAMVLLSDGEPNFWRACNCGSDGKPVDATCLSGCSCGSCPDDCDDCCLCQSTGAVTHPKARDWALQNAWSSWNNHRITIYTICYGNNCQGSGGETLRRLMRQIADITDNGVLDSPDGVSENYWLAPNDTQLRLAFAEIAERIYTRLVR